MVATKGRPISHLVVSTCVTILGEEVVDIGVELGDMLVACATQLGDKPLDLRENRRKHNDCLVKHVP